MKTITDHLRARLLRGVTAEEQPLQRQTLAALAQSEWSAEFEGYMRNRLLLGAYRYGLMYAKGRPKYDAVGSLIERARLYLEDGNQEHLVDIANLALLEFVRGCCHPSPHWAPTDDGIHTRRLDAE